MLSYKFYVTVTMRYDIIHERECACLLRIARGRAQNQQNSRGDGAPTDVFEGLAAGSPSCSGAHLFRFAYHDAFFALRSYSGLTIHMIPSEQLY